MFYQRADPIVLDSKDTTYFTPEGFLKDDPIITRTGVFTYHEANGKVRREYRPAEEVFDEESLKSYEGIPIIITHDARFITKNNVTDEEIGTVLYAYRDGDFLRAHIIIHDTDSMKESGLKELSVGYKTDKENTPGEFKGEHYDLIQRNIRANHLALVAEARAGEEARLNIDSKDKATANNSPTGGNEMGEEGKKTLTPEEFKQKVAELQGKGEEAVKKTEPAQEPEKDLTAAEKVQSVRDRRDCRKDAADPEDLEGAKKETAERDKDIDLLLDAIDELEAQKDLTAKTEKNDDGEEEEEEEDKNLNADSIDRIVRERVKVLRVGDRLNLDGLEDMSVLDMKKAIIKKVQPDINLDGKSKGYIGYAYDFAVENIIGAKKDVNYQRRQITQGNVVLNNDSADQTPAGLTGAQAARERMIERENGGK